MCLFDVHVWGGRGLVIIVGVVVVVGGFLLFRVGSTYRGLALADLGLFASDCVK